MKWKHVKGLPNEGFRRLTGVKQETFNKMVDLLQEALTKKNPRCPSE